MPAEIPAGLLALQQEVPSHLIGKLPKVTCPECRDKKNRGACPQHPKTQCPVCKGYLTPKHTHLDYVGHAETTSKLLEVDALWNWEPLAFGDDGLPAFDADGGLWIKLTVCGTTRLGYGTADNANGFKSRGDIRKEIIGDAIRNAAMRFGWALDLWAKADLHETTERAEQPQEAAPRRRQQQQVQRSKPEQPQGEWTGENAPPAPAQSAASMAQLNALNTLISKKHGNLPRERRLATVAKLAGRNLASSADLTKREASSVIEALNLLPDYQEEPRRMDLSDASPEAVAEAHALSSLPQEAPEDLLQQELLRAVLESGTPQELLAVRTSIEGHFDAQKIGKVHRDKLMAAADLREDGLAQEADRVREKAGMAA